MTWAALRARTLRQRGGALLAALLFRTTWPCSVAALVLAVPGALAAEAWPTKDWSAERMAPQVRWDIGAAMPDGPEDEPVIRQFRAYRDEDGDGREGVLVCLTLEFRTPDPGQTGAVLLYAPDAWGRLQLLGLPFYHGLEWMRGEVPLADACEAAEAGMLPSKLVPSPMERTP